jgi:uncharacterized protein (DUF433 family)
LWNDLERGNIGKCWIGTPVNPDRMSGAWLFKGSRVPVKALFENLEEGATVDEFLEWFPGITKEQVQAVLAHAEKSLASV